MPLVADTVNYGFSEKEALEYIRVRLGREISADSYYRRKRQIDTGQYAQQWLSYFTKVGFVIKHQAIINTIEMVQKDTIRNYLIENNKPTEKRSRNEVNRLRYEIRENSKLLQELSLGTPIVAQIKAKIDRLESTGSTNSSNQELEHAQSIPASK